MLRISGRGASILSEYEQLLLEAASSDEKSLEQLLEKLTLWTEGLEGSYYQLFTLLKAISSRLGGHKAVDVVMWHRERARHRILGRADGYSWLIGLELFLRLQQGRVDQSCTLLIEDIATTNDYMPVFLSVPPDLISDVVVLAPTKMRLRVLMGLWSCASILCRVKGDDYSMKGFAILEEQMTKLLREGAI